MNKKFLEEIVNLYADGSLSEEGAEALESAAMQDADLSHDMFTLKKTIESLRAQPGPAGVDESFQRIRMKLIAEGVDVATDAPEPIHWQYQLPIQS